MQLVVLTGAGMSAESGIPTFRGSNGLWEGHRIEDVASPEGWRKCKELVLEFYNIRRRNILQAKPNAAHIALANLEKYFDVKIITQNIDDLHERAGSSNILHLHGEILKSRSEVYEELIYDCNADMHIGDVCEKGFQLRPHIVWFGEPVPMMEYAAYISSQADIMIIIGTSMVVYPAASLIHYAPKGTPVFLINPDKPEIHFSKNITHIQKSATKGMQELTEILKDKYLLSD